jgi:hypothetical protein
MHKIFTNPWIIILGAIMLALIAANSATPELSGSCIPIA